MAFSIEMNDEEDYSRPGICYSVSFKNIKIKKILLVELGLLVPVYFFLLKIVLIETFS